MRGVMAIDRTIDMIHTHAGVRTTGSSTIRPHATVPSARTLECLELSMGGRLQALRCLMSSGTSALPTGAIRCRHTRSVGCNDGCVAFSIGSICMSGEVIAMPSLCMRLKVSKGVTAVCISEAGMCGGCRVEEEEETRDLRTVKSNAKASHA